MRQHYVLHSAQTMYNNRQQILPDCCDPAILLSDSPPSSTSISQSSTVPPTPPTPVTPAAAPDAPTPPARPSPAILRAKKCPFSVSPVDNFMPENPIFRVELGADRPVERLLGGINVARSKSDELPAAPALLVDSCEEGPEKGNAGRAAGPALLPWLPA